MYGPVPVLSAGWPDREVRGCPDGEKPRAPPACGGMDNSRFANLITIAAAVIIAGTGTILILLV